MKRMTNEEKEFFLKQVKRKGKALELKKKKPEEFQKYKDEYEKIVNYLQKNHARYFAFEIVRDRRCMDKKLLRRLLAEEKKNMLEMAKEELNRGNVPNLCLILFMMHVKYMTMWREKHG